MKFTLAAQGAGASKFKQSTNSASELFTHVGKGETLNAQFEDKGDWSLIIQIIGDAMPHGEPCASFPVVGMNLHHPEFCQMMYMRPEYILERYKPLNDEARDLVTRIESQIINRVQL